MKKLISLTLATLMLATCTSLFACNFDNLLGKSSTSENAEPVPTTSTTTTSTITPDEPNPTDIVFEHGDNFTEDDIEFVKSLQSKLTTEESSYVHMGFDSLFYNQSGLTPFVGHIDVNSAIIICGYIDIDIEENIYAYFKNQLDVSDYKWYKFDPSQEIPSTIENDELVWSYLLLDAYIEKNALTNEEFWYPFTYYMEIKENVVPNFLEQFETMIAYATFYNQKIGIDEYSFQNIYFGWFRPGYTDENGKPYLVFHEFTIGEDGVITDGYAKEELQEYYDILKPYFVVLKELDRQQQNNEKIVTYRYVGVDFNTLSELSLVFDGVWENDYD